MPSVDGFDWYLLGQEPGSRFSTRATVLWKDDEADGLAANVVVVFCNAVKVDGREPEKFPPLSHAGSFLQSLWLQGGTFTEFDHSSENPRPTTSDEQRIIERLQRKGGHDMQNGSNFHILIYSTQDSDGFSTLYGVGVGTNAGVKRRAGRIALGVAYATWDAAGQQISDEFFPDELREFVAYCRQYNTG